MNHHPGKFIFTARAAHLRNMHRLHSEKIRLQPRLLAQNVMCETTQLQRQSHVALASRA